MNNYDRIIRNYYPNALPHGVVISRVTRFIREELHINPDVLVAGNSICSDDINAIQFPNVGRELLGPFNLGGLGGYPFTGVTGISAFTHHKTDANSVLVFFAPHIGISLFDDPVNGVPGFVKRIGQNKASDCCGAMWGAIKIVAGIDEPIDLCSDVQEFQENSLVNILFPYKYELSRLPNNQKILFATNVLYENIKLELRALVNRQHDLPPGFMIVYVGGTIINVDDNAGVEAYLALDELRIGSPLEKTETDHLERFSQWVKESGG